MTTEEKKYSITNCHFENKSTPMSQAQCNALAELAKAVSANAKAIEAVAEALKGPTVIMERGISIGEDE